MNETITTLQNTDTGIFSVFNYPLLVNKTQCKTCGHIAKTYFEAECIDSGFCGNCDHVQGEVQDMQREWDSIQVTAEDLADWDWSSNDNN